MFALHDKKKNHISGLGLGKVFKAGNNKPLQIMIFLRPHQNITDTIIFYFAIILPLIFYVKSIHFSGKIQALVSATKEQRREYKSKFVDLDVEFARMRERLETMNMILDDIQVPFFEKKKCHFLV